MSHAFTPRVGGILSADIAVPDHEREVRFYSRVLTTGERPLWREDLMNNLGQPVIGLGPHSDEYAHLPLQWMPHIQVADVATSVERALALNGQELMHGKSESGESQWAVLLDPNGAAFGVIPVVTEDQMPPADDSATPVGHIAWLDPTVPDASATQDFYSQVVGWTVEAVEMEDTGNRYSDFNMLGGDEALAAGVCHARGANLDLTPVWLIYLPVGDLAESLRHVEEEGGQVLKAARGSDGESASEAVNPLGACLALLQG